ncbi:hypothetical protein CWI83_08770 [Pseudidiomarina taiwanensis]|uniref:Uncharacterized protein n=1 Tax=Pseudidiomarina taiwanensis TaxID=337250 RepID=A0A432ZES8_9GAMM|nr:hypothetical protein CWI83_08770 [Pseudidiomarina taiwanensis]
MSTTEKIQSKLNALEKSLKAQKHLEKPTQFYEQLCSCSIYLHLMTDEERDYINCARFAFEEQIAWQS